MTPDQVIQHFGGDIKKAAINLGVTEMAIRKWIKADSVPKLRQFELQVRTGGILQVDYER